MCQQSKCRADQERALALIAAANMDALPEGARLKLLRLRDWIRLHGHITKRMCTAIGHLACQSCIVCGKKATRMVAMDGYCHEHDVDAKRRLLHGGYGAIVGRASRDIDRIENEIDQLQRKRDRLLRRSHSVEGKRP